MECTVLLAVSQFLNYFWAGCKSNNFDARACVLQWRGSLGPVYRSSGNCTQTNCRSFPCIPSPVPRQKYIWIYNRYLLVWQERGQIWKAAVAVDGFKMYKSKVIKVIKKSHPTFLFHSKIESSRYAWRPAIYHAGVHRRRSLVQCGGQGLLWGWIRPSCKRPRAATAYFRLSVLQKTKEKCTD